MTCHLAFKEVKNQHTSQNLNLYIEHSPLLPSPHLPDSCPPLLEPTTADRSTRSPLRRELASPLGDSPPEMRALPPGAHLSPAGILRGHSSQQEMAYPLGASPLEMGASPRGAHFFAGGISRLALGDGLPAGNFTTGSFAFHRGWTMPATTRCRGLHRA